ncbi:hypothetical protein P3T37_003871 [Kitasatospora sp. MAA4]|uniref:hypothetical protein n=1 Tax=Kitasatospora sp. MAA4 TaxID=3035093 RepID=UPI0024758B00|nr:hypothetical protein [Kitasatospora sp. MAA4]MDH6134468.1 hypothetical protein [Kitasatospora sp. MAA4]
MQVRFAGASDLDERASRGASALKIGSLYHVIEIYVRRNGSVQYRIEYSAGEIPALFDSRLFTVASARLPSDWCVTEIGIDLLVFGSEKLRIPGFWEAFMDREPWTESLYMEARLSAMADEI